MLRLNPPPVQIKLSLAREACYNFTMKIPEEFKCKMKELFDAGEYAGFLEAFNKPRCCGLRVNTLKIGVEEFLELSPFKLEPVPWASDGFYYNEEESPGRHPFYHAGLYYIQEPSAMLPAEVLDARPGERVLDLCAAPGGKTVRIAAGMKGKGILVANDINPERVKALVKNIELCGVRNAIVTNETPEALAGKFSGFFDRVLVDAPCSGEGMFRKDEDAAKSWRKFECGKLVSVQKGLLESADAMLKSGGRLVYSTCTFSPEENEMQISDFLCRHNNYDVIDIPRSAGVEGGRPHWAGGRLELAGTSRLWPHKVRGEGHFVALLRKRFACRHERGEKREAAMLPRGSGALRELPAPTELFREFEDRCLNCRTDGYFTAKGGNLYCLPEEPPDLSGLKVAKFGWYLGNFSRGKFEPSHSLVVSLKKDDIKNTADFDSHSMEVLRYLKGETLMMDGLSGGKRLTAVCVNGYTLGWAKQEDDMLKNLYPKGWRRLT